MEETFQFQLPEHVAVSSDEDRTVGEGCYVSATVHNRRYYGVLVDQASLQAASMLYFQDEASGLELNRKMEYLYRLQQHDAAARSTNEEEVVQNHTVDDVDMEESSLSTKKRVRETTIPDGMTSSSTGSGPTAMTTKRMKSSSSSMTSTEAVQQFRFVPATGTSSSAYRILMATYMDAITAAAQHPDRDAASIEAACRTGGNFVGEFYYQYEVRVCFLFGTRVRDFYRDI